MTEPDATVRQAAQDAEQAVGEAVDGYTFDPEAEEVGHLESVAQSVAWATGMERVQAEEMVLLGRDDPVPGLVLDLLPDRLGIVLLGRDEGLSAGDEVRRTGRILDVPVGGALTGRVVDPLGRPLDGGPPPRTDERLPLEREAPPIMHRSPVQRPLQTGLKVVDALIPVGRGQRELIVGDRQSGKTAVALDAVANQAQADCLCIYCAIGQRGAAVARVVDELRNRGAMDYTTVVVAGGDDPPGLVFAAPYAAASMAEHFMARGRDVLVVYDDLSKHALAYRQLSLLLRRPPGREAYPGDIFYIHSRLLERATRLRPEHGGGSMTALPVVETEAQNISAFIPTNLISITDGQIYLSPSLFQKGVLPAVDVSRSVSRVGGKAQLPGYAAVSGELKLSYAQFEELEDFARFGTRMDETTRQTLERGRRVREALKQDRFSPLTPAQQLAVLFAVSQGLFDHVPLDRMAKAQRDMVDALDADAALAEALGGEQPPEQRHWDRVVDLAARVLPREASGDDAGDKEETG